MRLRSVSDVITNSSTEVFLLDTTKSLPEVSRILSEITEGYTEPEILTSESRILGLLSDDYDYLHVDSQRYTYWVLTLDEFYWRHNFDSDLPKDFLKTRELWKNYIWENREGLDLRIPESEKEHLDEFIYEISDTLPKSFLPSFLESVFPEGIPDYLTLPEERAVEYWVGKIGFMGKGDNTIPYQDFPKIISEFGGSCFHLG